MRATRPPPSDAQANGQGDDTDEQQQATIHHLSSSEPGTVVQRDSVLDCASPLALSESAARSKAPEGWRSPRPCGALARSWEIALGSVRAEFGGDAQALQPRLAAGFDMP